MVMLVGAWRSPLEKEVQGSENFFPSPRHLVSSCQSTRSGHHLKNGRHIVKILENYGGNVFVEKQDRVLGGVGENPAGSDG